MSIIRSTAADKLAITLSSVCVLHCFLTPLLLLILPSLAVFGLDSEWFHRWMVVGVLPISLYALTLGCKQHKNYNFFALGLLGMILLVAALFVEDALFGEYGEKVLTLIGTVIIATSHYFNFSRCRKVKQPEKGSDCAC